MSNNDNILQDVQDSYLKLPSQVRKDNDKQQPKKAAKEKVKYTFCKMFTLIILQFCFIILNK